MSSWGIDPSSADQKPKYLLDNEVTKYRREDSYATNQGWVMRAGSPATGNGNLSASPEILVAIGGLSGISSNAGFKLEQYTHDSVSEVGGLLLDSTDGTANAGDDLLLEMGDGLGTPTITDIRIISGIPTIDHFLLNGTDGTSADADDAILLDSTNGTANAGEALTCENGEDQTVEVEITWDEAITVAGTPQVTCVNGNQGTGSGRTCVLSFTATGSSANRKRFTATNITVAANDVITLGGADQLALNSGTISDTEAGSTNVPVFLDLSDITAVTQTIA